MSERKWIEMHKRLEETEDQEGLMRLEFGRYIALMRSLISKKYSQGQAAKRAGISRVEWNRIENCHVLPHPSNIPNIADALNMNPSVLFKKAGLPVPKEFSVYDKKRAFRDLDSSLDECRSLTQFIIHMEDIWQSYQFAQTGVLPKRFVLEPNFAAAMAFVLEHLSKGQRLQLALAIVREARWQDVEAAGISYQYFFDSIDILLNELRTNFEIIIKKRDEYT